MFLVITIVHAGHRHAVIVIKEARAQVHVLKSYVCQLLLVLNNGCGIKHCVEHNNYADCVAKFSLGMFTFCVLL